MLLLGPHSATAQLRAQLIVSGLTNPVAYVMDPDDHSTFYAVEQGGAIRGVRDGVLSPALFLDIRADVSAGGERGLLAATVKAWLIPIHVSI